MKSYVFFLNYLLTVSLLVPSFQRFSQFLQEQVWRSRNWLRLPVVELVYLQSKKYPWLQAIVLVELKYRKAITYLECEWISRGMPSPTPSVIFLYYLLKIGHEQKRSIHQLAEKPCS